MLYTIVQGPVEKRIMQQCLRERVPFPKAIENAPDLWFGSELFFGAFLDLDGDRPSGWDVRPIPRSVIMDYCRESEITGEQADDVFTIVRKMDKAYIKHCQKKSKTGKKK